MPTSGPIQAGWLNQIGIYFSIIAKPCDWRFTRDDLNQLVQRLDLPRHPGAALAAHNTCVNLWNGVFSLTRGAGSGRTCLPAVPGYPSRARRNRLAGWRSTNTFPPAWSGPPSFAAV